MKKTRVLSLLLAVLMLAGGAVLFSSCAKKGEIKLSGKKVEVDFSEYALVYGDSMSENEFTRTYKEKMADFATALSAATGEGFIAQTEDRAKTGKNDKEILIGLTNREESKKAYNSIKGDGFAIQVTENKIVIVGSSNVFTLMAVEYFKTTFLNVVEKPEAKLQINQSAKANQMATTVLADTESSYFSYVFQDGLRTDPKCPDYASVSGDFRDYCVVAAENIVKQMAKLSGLRERAFSTITDTENAEKEVLVGVVDREESVALRATVAEDQYILNVTENRVVLNAWCTDALDVCVDTYIDLLAEAVTADKVIALPVGFTYTGAVNEDWITDFTKPEGEGIELYNTMNATDDSLQYIYMGDGVTADALKAYCNTLKGEGYTVLTESEAEGSVFVTLVNQKKNHTIYASFNAYAHKDEFAAYSSKASKVKTGDIGWYDFEKCFRIVSTPISSVTLPDDKILKKQPYDKIADAAIATMPLHGNAVGLIYVIMLEDGRFIVFDGGNMGESTGDEDVRLYGVMKDLKEKYTGKAVSASNPVHIAAWIVTHPHGDHFYVFNRVLSRYGQNGTLKMDYLFGNYPNEFAAYTHWAHGSGGITEQSIKNWQSLVKGGFKYIKVHTGQKFYFANLEIEVLTTWEDLNPRVTYTSNDTNTVLRFTMTNKDNPNEKNVQIWTGDANRWQSRYLCAMYGSYLDADMVSVAHHGNLGLECEFYDLVSPTAIWWPHNMSAYKMYTTPANISRGWQYEVDQHFVYNIPSVKYIFVSGDAKGTNDKYYTVLELRKTGPAFDEVYDLKTGELIPYDGTVSVKK